mgnify:CR=1 FL=1
MCKGAIWGITCERLSCAKDENKHFVFFIFSVQSCKSKFKTKISLQNSSYVETTSDVKHVDVKYMY